MEINDQHPRAWAWVAILMAGYAISVMDRVSIGLLVTPIKRDLLLTDTMIGLIQGAAFGLFYIGLALPLGRWIDRGNRRRILLGGILVWSAATFASAFAEGATGLFAARLFIGAGEATLTPVSASLIADLFAERRRPLAFGFFTVGVGFGMGTAFALTGGIFALSPSIDGWLAPWGARFADWRLTFMVMSLPGFMLAMAIWLFVAEPVRRRNLHARQGRFGDVMRVISGAPRPFVGLILGAAMLQFAGTIMISWFPTVLIRSHGLTPGGVGALMGPIAIFVGIPSAVSAGLLVGRLSRIDPARAPMLSLIIGTLCYASTCVMALMSAGTTAAIVWFACSALFSNWAIPATLSGLAILTPNHLRAQMVAIQMVVIGVISLGIGPALTGYVADRFFRFPAGIAIAASLLIAFAGVLGAGVLGAGLLRRGFGRLPSGNRVDPD